MKLQAQVFNVINRTLIVIVLQLITDFQLRDIV